MKQEETISLQMSSYLGSPEFKRKKRCDGSADISNAYPIFAEKKKTIKKLILITFPLDCELKFRVDLASMFNQV